MRAAFTGEAAFRQLVLLNVVLIPLSFFLNVSRVERALLIAVCLLALIVELLNSAIEAAIDQRTSAQVLAAALFARFSSREKNELGNRFLSALRNKFGGHPSLSSKG